MNWSVYVITGLVFVLGASVGSFINVVAYRLPADLSLLNPPSRCPKCYTRLKAKDNIPILGWLLLKGKCRYCQAPISPRYAWVEAVVASLFLIAFLSFGPTLPTVGAWVLMSWLVALTLIDLDTMTLPNMLTQWGLLLGLGYQVLVALAAQPSLATVSRASIDGVFAAVLGLLIFDGIRVAGALILRQDAMGGGDPKLAAMIGAWLGWKLMLVSAFLACLFGSVIGVGGMVTGKLGRRQQIPFGPYLALGAIAALFFGEKLITAYLAAMGF
jgi:leader peptidase (prepilin peptidase)/N-methyltransferase